MNKKGTAILLFWCVLNALPGVGSLIYLLLGRHAPGLRMRFDVAEIPLIEERALATIDGLATMANTLIVTFCIISILILLSQKRAYLLVLAGCLVLIQLAGYISDQAFFLGQNVGVLNISSLILIVGFGMLFSPSSQNELKTK